MKKSNGHFKNEPPRYKKGGAVKASPFSFGAETERRNLVLTDHRFAFVLAFSDRDDDLAVVQRPNEQTLNLYVSSNCNGTKHSDPPKSCSIPKIDGEKSLCHVKYDKNVAKSA